VDVLKENDHIRAAFEANFQRGLERGAQLVVYDNGEKTVDLSGITLPENPALRPYDGDSISMVWSSGKVLEAIAMCILVDGGFLKYEERVSKYWPGFAKNGKGNILVQDILTHDSGLFSLARKLRYDETLTSIGEVIKNSVPICKGRVYHAYSRGLILNQICIRCDPKQRTIARLLEDELFSKIGMADYFILGHSSEEALKRVHPFTNRSIPWWMANVMCPSLIGCNMPWTNTSKETRKFYRNVILVGNLFKSSVVFQNSFPIDMKAQQRISADPSTNIESPSTWILTSARLMAKCAALMSQGGVFNGVRILKQSTVDEALSNPKIDVEKLFNFNITFTKGGFGVMGIFSSPGDITQDDYYGWGGVNGSMMMFQYKRGNPGGRAFAYNCSACNESFPYDIRGMEICKQLGRDTGRLMFQKLRVQHSSTAPLRGIEVE